MARTSASGNQAWRYRRSPPTPSRAPSAHFTPRPAAPRSAPGLGGLAALGSSGRGLLRPWDEDRVLVGRIASDHVLGGLVVEVLEHMRLARRDIDQVSRLQRDLPLELLAPTHQQPSSDHVDGALALLVIVSARLRAWWDPEHSHINVARPRRALGDLGAAQDAAGHLVVGPRLDDPHGASLTVAMALRTGERRRFDSQRRLLGGRVVDLKGGVADLEPGLEQALEPAPELVAIGAGHHQDVRRQG